MTADVTRYYLDHSNNMYSPIAWAALPRSTSNEFELNGINVPTKRTVDQRDQLP